MLDAWRSCAKFLWRPMLLSALPITAIRTAIAFRILALLDPINIDTVAISRPCTVPQAVRDFEITLLLTHTASHSRTSYSE